MNWRRYAESVPHFPTPTPDEVTALMQEDRAIRSLLLPWTNQPEWTNAEHAAWLVQTLNTLRAELVRLGDERDRLVALTGRRIEA